MKDLKIPEPSLHVGDWVTIAKGNQIRRGRVVEDRGRIGAGGRRLLRVAISMEPFEPIEVEIPENEMTRFEPEKERRIDRQEAIDYLAEGGLVSILGSNTGGKHSECAWLVRNSLGDVTHTYIHSLGETGLGGDSVPFGCLNGERIREKKQPNVIKFLKSFGLTDDDARVVVERVGTSAH